MSPIQEIIKHLHVKQGDITREAIDAIVNAANPTLLGGGGVDGAIHRAAGPGLLQECRKLGGCAHGEARITGGHNLKAKHVIHTPGPIYKNGKSGEPELLKNSYMNSLLLAREHGLQSIAFPAISTGVYGYLREAACKIAVDTAVEFMKKYDYLIEIYFVLFDKENAAIYSEYIDGLKS
jgi:O-acetyl-ADP-ribose deacetylase (regulator of RNase III)